MKKFLIIFISLTVFAGCSAAEKDLNKPEISIDEYSSPQNCNMYSRGTILPVRTLFTDDYELGNFNIEIHNNFDHHSHSTEATECSLGPKKTAVHPWVFNQDYAIPRGNKAYEVDLQIPIPTNIDDGPYHFIIRLTDQAGWQQFRAFSIVIKE